MKWDPSLLHKPRFLKTYPLSRNASSNTKVWISHTVHHRRNVSSRHQTCAAPYAQWPASFRAVVCIEPQHWRSMSILPSPLQLWSVETMTRKQREGRHGLSAQKTQPLHRLSGNNDVDWTRLSWWQWAAFDHCDGECLMLLDIFTLISDLTCSLM